MIAEGALKAKDAEDGQKNEAKAPQVAWNIGDLEFEAYMRMLDSAVSFFFEPKSLHKTQRAVTLTAIFFYRFQGYRTGYSYRLPSVTRPKSA